MSESHLPSQTSEPDRRPVQWSLRSMLVTMALVAAYFAWFRVVHPRSAFWLTFFFAPAGTIFVSRCLAKVQPCWAAILGVAASILAPIAFMFFALIAPGHFVPYGDVLFFTEMSIAGSVGFFWGLCNAFIYVFLIRRTD